MGGLNIQITTAPCCWGVDDVHNPNIPDWLNVFKEASLAGYKGLELGPYGYVPNDIELISKLLKQYDLFIVAGTIFNDLVSLNNRETLLHQTKQICKLISQLPQPEAFNRQHYKTPYLTVMDWGHDERDFAAGHSDRAPRLSRSVWLGMMENIRLIADCAADYGVRAVIHPHAGGYIEFADEIEQLVKDIDIQVAGLCIDTGHCYYAGMNPTDTILKYHDRIDYVHFKDINLDVFNEVMQEKIRFFDACGKGVMCPIGKGVLDYIQIRDALKQIGYEGFITIEQERDPKQAHGSLIDVKASRDYLKDIRFL
ncbi:TIM barrel protein [Commensalibacter oyaizuii]|uniref:TIM barrel protein n=1 Tax=Commensalibacter oyaizuii TaxID=3043873 RepID=A0ABT6Q042_9PROT|nr:TIM barrel protein [Commensalibacter sp. TBRC 16381]MDI2090485.1 TIM barrel protein [Commensalibacter sp. TBRC 16381]